MPATTIAHLRTAVIEALTTDRTATYTRAIPADYLFQRGLPPGLDPQIRSTRCTGKPGVFVVVSRVTPHAGVGTELGSDHLYDCQIVISRDYYLGHEQIHADIDSVFTRVTDDLFRMRAALCYPGALDQTAAGHATGIAPEALIPFGDQSVLTVESIGTGTNRLLNARDVFLAHFQYQPS